MDDGDGTGFDRLRFSRDQIVPEERRRLILEMLRQRRSISVAALEDPRSRR